MIFLAYTKKEYAGLKNQSNMSKLFENLKEDKIPIIIIKVKDIKEIEEIVNLMIMENTRSLIKEEILIKKTQTMNIDLQICKIFVQFFLNFVAEPHKQQCFNNQH